jgi:hypothetical protein
MSTYIRSAVMSALHNDTSGTFAKLLEENGRTVEDAAEKLAGIIDNATREREGGQFIDPDLGRAAW